MLDHIGIAISDICRSEAFYAAALAPLGIAKILEYGPDKTESGGTAIGCGKDEMPFFWIGDNERVGEGTHIAFAALDRATVDAFYAAAMAAGGTDHGPPGIRANYHPNYYGAFVLDPDGVNVEAVSHRPE
jgi:catechol 2,3-dioxygenase-like lactoylglutathione lyase family enzyme